jgi:hypothetical protein
MRHLIAGCCLLMPSFLFAATSAAEIKPPIIAAHYFGQHWPKNFISAFRRDAVAADFKQLHADGFNTVILLVSWGDFQPVIEPCCDWDERAFARLQFLLDEAAQADLHVILRVGYGWSMQPRAGSSLQRIHQLLNTDATRIAFFSFIKRLGQFLTTAPHVTMTLMSWEDQWLHHIDPTAQTTFDDFNSILPAKCRLSVNAQLPTVTGERAALFHAYWDWLVMNRLYEPARALLPNLSYEIRVDKDPIPQADSSVTWLEHRAMYRQAGAAPVTIYWAPFWGAENVGEQLTAARANELLTALLRETQKFSGNRPIFIDQFNVVDNTPGYERNAVIAPPALDDFLMQAACTLKQNGVIGYGYWTTRDYRESLLHNPSFSFGLEGWELHQESSALDSVIHSLPSGDMELHFNSGAVLTQTIAAVAGRLPTQNDDRKDHICIEVGAGSSGRVSVTAGNLSQPAQLDFAVDKNVMQCSELVAVPAGEQLTLQITAKQNTALKVHGVWLFDHIQIGGLYDVNGQPSFLHQSLVRFGEKLTECR